MLSHQLPPSIDVSIPKAMTGFLVSALGGFATYLAQFTPNVVEGWMQLGGIAITIAGLGWAVRYLIGKNEAKDAVIFSFFSTIDELRKSGEARLEAERQRLELKWDTERKENLLHREKDRDSRDKLSDAVDKLADKVSVDA